MGIAKPYEFEVGSLGGPPTRRRLDVGARMGALIEPAEGGLTVAGRHLTVGPDEEPAEVVRRLRETLTARLYARRPDADEHTWSSFTRLAQGIVREHETLDAVERSLLVAIDGL